MSWGTLGDFQSEWHLECILLDGGLEFVKSMRMFTREHHNHIYCLENKDLGIHIVYPDTQCWNYFCGTLGKNVGTAIVFRKFYVLSFNFSKSSQSLLPCWIPILFVQIICNFFYH